MRKIRRFIRKLFIASAPAAAIFASASCDFLSAPINNALENILPPSTKKPSEPGKNDEDNIPIPPVENPVEPKPGKDDLDTSGKDTKEPQPSLPNQHQKTPDQVQPPSKKDDKKNSQNTQKRVNPSKNDIDKDPDVDEKKYNSLIEKGKKNFTIDARGFSSSSRSIALYESRKNNDIYVDFEEIVSRLDRIYGSGRLDSSQQSFWKVSYDLGNNTKLIFDEYNDRIQFNSDSVFALAPANYLPPKENFIKFLLNKTQSFSGYEGLKTLDLKKYDMDIIVDSGKVYLPLSIFNLIFASNNYFNVVYNNDKFSAIDYDKVSAYNNSRRYPSAFYDIFDNNTSSISKVQSPTKQQRINNFHYLAFLFDNFYGLSHKLYSQFNATNFYDFASKTELEEKLLSSKPEDYRRAYESLIYSYLNDLHSSIVTKSFYGYKSALLRGKKRGSIKDPGKASLSSVHKHHKEIYDFLKEKRQYSAHPLYHDLNLNNKITHIYKDTARIVFDSFEGDGSSNIENGQYDSFNLIRAALEKIATDDKENNVKNIVLDISLNGGGSVLAMQQVLGFITQKPIEIVSHNIASHEFTLNKYSVDTNKDGLFNEKDYITKYNWYVLIGQNTFSAANLFAHVAKKLPNVKVIGQKSGGGMFAILPTVLPDGTFIYLSGPNGFSAYNGKNIHSIADIDYTENGVEPDYKLGYDHFYEHNLLDYLDKNAK